MTTTAVSSAGWTSRHTLALGTILAGIVLLELLLPASLRVLAWLSALALMAAFALVVGQGITGRWLGVLIDSTHKMSLSRLQMLLWTILILSGLLTAVAANVAAGVSEPLAITIPAPLWVLMGISTASMVGTPILQNVQQRRPTPAQASQAPLTASHFSGQLVLNERAEAASSADLFAGSQVGTLGLVDIGQMQMVFFTLILLLAQLFTSGGAISALPSLDTGMLALLGISHAGFLADQAIPQINTDLSN